MKITRLFNRHAAAVLVVGVFAAGTLPVEAACKPFQRGIASVYADSFNGQKMANGRRFSQGGHIAAHRSLPLGTRVLVHDLRTGKSFSAVIGDRGPYVGGRIIDLPAAIWYRLGHGRNHGHYGTAPVRLDICR